MSFHQVGFWFLLLLNLGVSSIAYADSGLNYEKALSAYNEKRFDVSMVHLKNALQSSPDNLPSKILMGKL